MNSEPAELTIWSRDTGERIPCFDSRHSALTWIILAKRRKCSTNWGDCKSNKSNQINQINQISQINQIKSNVGF